MQLDQLLGAQATFAASAGSVLSRRLAGFAALAGAAMEALQRREMGRVALANARRAVERLEQVRARCACGACGAWGGWGGALDEARAVGRCARTLLCLQPTPVASAGVELFSSPCFLVCGGACLWRAARSLPAFASSALGLHARWLPHAADANPPSASHAATSSSPSLRARSSCR